MGDPWRMADANLNRAAEALRCLEDVARFGLGLAAPSAGCKSLRHMVSQLRAALPAGRLLASRDVAADPGPATRGAMEDGRRTLADVAAAAAARAGESLRALEEALKVASPAHAAEAERIRYRSYEAAAAVVTAAGAGGGPQWRLCLLLTESLCRRPWLEVLRDAVRGGVDCVQLREKSLDDRALLERARRVVEAARAGGAAVVINDRPDVALACGADGVHLGRRDLPVAAVRRLGTLVCRIELDKTTGAKVTIENADGKITQTIHMDGTKITTKVAGEQDTSTIEQVADAITITVKNFTLDAETVLLKSSKTSTWQSQDTLDVKSSKAMTIKSDQTQLLEATQDATYKGMNIGIKAQTDLKAEGINVALKGTAELKGEAAQLALKGTAQAKLEGAMVEVKADGMLTAQSSGMTTLKGSLTSVEGSLVKLG